MNRTGGGGDKSSEEVMTTFDKREQAFESQFAHDEELKFKAMARRNYLLGVWVAEKLGLAGAEAEAYARELVVSEVEKTSDDEMIHKIRADLDAKGTKLSDRRIRRAMDELMGRAVSETRARG
jgi:hypothetical protein